MAGPVWAGAQVFDCYEGQGVLENAWADWSWCSNNFQSTAYSFGGPYSVQVSFTGPWQGFSLETPVSFPAGYFSALSFTINGGTSSGRAIQVSFTVNGSETSPQNLNGFIQGGQVVANSWKRVTIPLSAFGLAPGDSISRFSLQDSSGNSQPAFYLDQIGWTPNPPPQTTLSVDARTILHSVDPKMFGVNTAIWDSGFTSTTCKNLISAAGFRSMRFPGGSASDGYHWATNTTDNNSWTWATSFDDFASVAVPRTGGECFITVNYGTGTPQEAAAWVQHSNVMHGYGIKYWELGNEVYGSWEEDGHARPHDPVVYAQAFAQYYQQMKAIDPTIKIGAVAVPGEDDFANYGDEHVTNPRTHVSHSGWTPVMLATLAGLGVTPDFVAYHRYPEYLVDCDFTLLISNSSWAADMASLRQQLQDYLGAANSQTQIMCTENNSDAAGNGKQMCSLVNGLYMADSFGAALQTECRSFTWWDLINGQATDGDMGSWLYGWRMYGDLGVMSPDFTQTYPVFYMEQLFNLFARSGDGVVSAGSSYGLLSVFATKRADGTVRLMVVNKNPSASFSVRPSFTGFNPGGTVTVYSYGIPQDNAAQAGQAQVLSVSHVGASSAITFAPYSATVLVYVPKPSPPPIIGN